MSASAPGGTPEGGEGSLWNPLTWGWKVQLAVAAVVGSIVVLEARRKSRKKRRRGAGGGKDRGGAEALFGRAGGGSSTEDGIPGAGVGEFQRSGRAGAGGVDPTQREVTLSPEEHARFLSWEDARKRAQALRASQQLEAAERLMTAGIEVLASIPALQGHLAIADAKCELAEIIRSQGRFRDAIKEYDEALVIRAAAVGTKHPLVASTVMAMADVLMTLEQFTEAGPMVEQARRILIEALGEDHLQTAMATDALSFVRTQDRQFDEAEELSRQALAVFRENLGPTSPLTVTSAVKQAAMFRMQQRWMDAEQVYRALQVEFAADGLPDSDPLVYAVLNNLCSLFWDMGKDEEAENIEAKLVRLPNVAPPKTFSLFLSTVRAHFSYHIPAAPANDRKGKSKVEPRSARAHICLIVHSHAWEALVAEHGEDAVIYIKGEMENPNGSGIPVAIEHVVTSEEREGVVEVTSPEVHEVAARNYMVRLGLYLDPEHTVRVGRHHQLCHATYDLDAVTRAQAAHHRPISDQLFDT